MIWKQFKVFLRLKKEELTLEPRSIQELKDALCIILILIIGIAIVFLLFFVIGFLLTLVWSYPYEQLQKKNPKDSAMSIYTVLGLCCFALTLGFLMISYLSITFVRWIAENWEEAGRIIKEQENK